MPHVVVKVMSGRTEAVKKQLSEKLTQAVMDVLGSDAGSISVAIEDVPAGRWDSEVFEPEIKGRKNTLYKKPGYASVD